MAFDFMSAAPENDTCARRVTRKKKDNDSVNPKIGCDYQSAYVSESAGESGEGKKA